MTTRADALQETLAHACVGFTFSEIMSALTLVTGAMISIHAKSPEHADDMAITAGKAIRLGIGLYQVGSNG